MAENSLVPQESEFRLYTSPDGEVKVETILRDETMWLSQKRMAELFGVDVRTINEHLKAIYAAGEVRESSTIRKFRIVQIEGARSVSREVAFYGLDAIISVGYRVNSAQATRFRQWATATLREYVVKGYVMDDARLKSANPFGKDYFDELLERIRDIRASERRFYQKITDIYSQCSADYDKDSPETHEFFATVQNKLHWAITGHTAAETIRDRADAGKPNMGLTTWKNSPSGRIRKADVVVAKNYLDENELSSLNRIVTMYLDYAEDQASRGVVMRMADWKSKLDAFLRFNEREVLGDAGKVAAEVAKTFAEGEFEKFRVVQDGAHVSDFDREVTKMLEAGKGRNKKKAA